MLHKLTKLALLCTLLLALILSSQAAAPAQAQTGSVIGSTKILGNSEEGSRFVASQKGQYTFKYTSGSYSTWPTAQSTEIKWRTRINIYKNRPISWEQRPYNPEDDKTLIYKEPRSADSIFGNYNVATQSDSIQFAQTQSQFTFNLNSGDYLIFVAIDDQNWYNNPAPNIGDITFEISFSPDISSQGFRVNPDGFSFVNFSYYGANWEQFKKAFPGTNMELSNGSHRKGPQLYFDTEYRTIGEGGNCAGFTAISLIRYLGLAESVEPSLLTINHQVIKPTYNFPAVVAGDVQTGQSDVKDYIHLYQARQMSYEYGLWWGLHWNDTPMQSYQAIKAKTQAGEPVAVSIWQAGRGGHRMTAYRTEESGNTGYIYIYDNNWPNDSTRRIEINLSTGQWSYTLWQGEVWGGTTNLRYSLASTNFPASLNPQYQNRLFPTETSGETVVNVVGQAQLLITDAQGRKLGYNNGQLVSEIPGAAFMPIDAYNPNNPNAPATESFFLPSNSSYQIAIQPTSNGAYNLTAFGSGSALLLGNISVSANTVDTLTLNGNILDTAFKPATDKDFCHYITRDVSDTVSRDFKACINGDTALNANFTLNPTGDSLQVANLTSQPVTLRSTIDQAGDNAGTSNFTQQLNAGQNTVIQASTSSQRIYLPLIVK